MAQPALNARERLSLIERVEIEGIPVSQACKEYGISRFTFYKWRKRWKKGGQKIDALQDKKLQIERRDLRVKSSYENKILSLIVEFPKLSKYEIANKVQQSLGPVVGIHGVYNVLKRHGLSTPEARLAYAEGYYAPPATSEHGFEQKIIFSINKIFGNLVPAPLPVFSSIPKVLATGIIAVGFLFAAYYSFGWWIEFITTKAPSIAIGTVFATVALTSGMLFFVYSLKYYISLAIVLSFSQQESRVRFRQKARKSISAWILGLATNGHQPGGAQGLEGNGEELSGPVGLTPNLEHITLKRYPKVSVHIPLYNEKKVVERILNSVTSFDYPGDYEIIIADDSTDETSQIIFDYLRSTKSQISSSKGEGYTLMEVEIRSGVVLKHLHRTSRSGFKGGALREALRVTDPKAEFVTVFDADFVPYPDTLELFLKYFKVQNSMREDYSKSKVAAVQGYQWHVLNKSENWITRGVRSEYAGSYVIERSGGEIYSGLKMISGSVYMIRRDVLDEIGWETSITEDFQLTLKLYEKGYKVVYTPYIQAPAECVSTLKRLIRQRMRWAEGHSNNIKRMFGRLLLNPKLTFSEKLEFLYLSPYYLQSFFFLIGTISWLISETLFPARLPFWTSLWGWSLVLTNFLCLPLMNAVGLFLEESEEKDYVGLTSFVVLTYILVPFQAYASLKGFLQQEEGPWFRTPKTGRITDIFRRGTFYRFISGILPGRVSAHPNVATNLNSTNVSESKQKYLDKLGVFSLGSNSYLSLATANSRFDSFKIRPKGYRFIGNLVLIFALISSLALSYFGANIKKGSLADLPIQTRVEKVGEKGLFLTQVFKVFSPQEVMAATEKAQGVIISGVKQVPLETLIASAGLVLLLTLALLIHLYKKKRIFFKKAVKLVFVFSLILTWLLTGWPVIWKNPRFPPKIKEAQAAVLEVSATADSASPGTTDAVMTDMTITPGEGNYLAVFSTSFESSAAVIATVSIYVNAVKQAHTEREARQETSIMNNEMPLATHAYITVGDGQAVDVRWRSSAAATMVARKRTLNLFPVASTDVSQATATADTTLDSGTYTLLNSMTQTPGAGDYLLLFSTSADGPLGDKLAFAVFVNGSIVQHTERTQFQEGSIGNTEFVTFIAAKVSPGAGQAVEIRWAEQVNVTGSITAHERTLTLYKTDTANILEASATADTTATNTASDELLASMTQTPGAGNYLALFSSSYLNGAGASQTMFNSFYVNAVQTAHTERQPIWEGSLDDTDIPVMTNGLVSPGASQAVEVRWRGSISETRTAHERTFVLLKAPVFNQSAYRFFNNNTANTTDVGAALAAQDTAASLTSDGQDFRLRLLIHISDAQLAISGQNFKLQIAVRSGTCDTGFVGETYSDLATAAGDIRYFDDTDTAKTDGADLTANASDPTHAADTIRNQDYEEANNFTNTVAAIATGEDGKWDFSIVDFSAADNTTYCLRVVESGGTVLTTYTVIPEFTTVPENGLLMLGLAPMLMGMIGKLRRRKRYICE